MYNNITVKKKSGNPYAKLEGRLNATHQHNRRKYSQVLRLRSKNPNGEIKKFARKRSRQNPMFCIQFRRGNTVNFESPHKNEKTKKNILFQEQRNLFTKRNWMKTKQKKLFQTEKKVDETFNEKKESKDIVILNI